MCEPFGHVEHVTQLEGIDEFGIENARVVVYGDIFIAFFERANGVAGGFERVLGSENPRAFFHRFAEIIADMGHALCALVAAKELGFDALLLVLRHFAHPIQIRKIGIRSALRGRFARSCAEDQALGQRVGPQAIGAVEADASGFACGVKTRDGRCTCDVGMHAAHAVVNHRTHGNRLINRVDAHVIAGEFAHKGQFFVDDFFAQVPEIEVDVAAIRPFENIAFALFVNKGTREDVARPQFHFAGHVFAEVAFAFAVDEVAALAPRCFGH